MNLALFDFDGTITKREMFPDFMRFAVSKRRLLVGSAFFAPMVLGYKLGIVSGSTIRRHLVNFGFSGVRADRFEKIGKQFSDDVLPDALRPMALERIRWHKAQGDVVVIVSGALDVYLRHWCRTHDVDLICSSLEVENGRLTGRFRGAQAAPNVSVRRNPGVCAKHANSMIFRWFTPTAIPRKTSTCSASRTRSSTAGRRSPDALPLHAVRSATSPTLSLNGHQMITSDLIRWAMAIPRHAVPTPPHLRESANGHAYPRHGGLAHHQVKEFCNGKPDPHAQWARPEPLVGQHHTHHPG